MTWGKEKSMTETSPCGCGKTRTVAEAKCHCTVRTAYTARATGECRMAEGHGGLVRLDQLRWRKRALWRAAGHGCPPFADISGERGTEHLDGEGAERAVKGEDHEGVGSGMGDPCGANCRTR